jgi:MFS family permease
MRQTKIHLYWKISSSGSDRKGFGGWKQVLCKFFPIILPSDDYCAALWVNVFLSGFDGTITASTYALISSEFNAANSASWLTTSYLISSTAFQPLYGRFSDIIGRRGVFFVATLTFMLGCLGCAATNHILLLNAMRCLTGIGGGGLITIGV